MSQKESPLQIIKKAYSDVITLEADDLLSIDIFIATLTACFCSRLKEPVWIYIIAPAGAGKTLVVGQARGFRKCLLLTTPTENSWMSGYTDDDGNDPSILNLINGSVVIWKDFTALIKGPPRTTAKIFGEMRDSYDGYSSKASGMAGVRDYVCRYGQIACVTNSIDAFSEENQQLGERFLSFRMYRIRRTHTERVKGLDVVVDSMDGKEKWEEELRKIVHAQLERINTRAKMGNVPTVPAGAMRKMKVLADLLALLRTVPDDMTAQDPEKASRIIQQMLNLGKAHAMADFRDEWDSVDTGLIQRVFVDSLSAVRARLLRFLYAQGPHRPSVTVLQMMKKAMTGQKDIERIANQYIHSGVFVEDRSQQDTSKESWYRLSTDVYKSFREVGVFEKG